MAPRVRATPYPGAARVLDRPFHNLSGRRHVPFLVNANRVAFLRINKPQPIILNRIIRNTVKTRNHRLVHYARLAKELPLAQEEDRWDRHLHKHTGLDLEDPSVRPWQHEVKRAFDENHKVQVEAIQKRADISAKLYAISEQEKVLADEEKRRIRDGKHKVRKARRLARKGLGESEIHNGADS